MADEIEAPPKKSPLKLAVVGLVVLLIQAGIVIGAMMVVGKPAEVRSEDLLNVDQLPEEEQIVEILVLDAKLPNAKKGVTYLYDTEIYVQVKKKHELDVSKELEQFRNEIRAQITAIWRAAEPNHFLEPHMENLTRKAEALLRDRFDDDPEAEEPVIQKCVIVSGTGFRIDS